VPKRRPPMLTALRVRMPLLILGAALLLALVAAG
jgi:hypothetical protein